MLRCAASGCEEKVIGGRREKIHERFLDGTSKIQLDKPVFYCRKHKVEADQYFAGKAVQTLTEGQLVYWSTQ